MSRASEHACCGKISAPRIDCKQNRTYRRACLDEVLADGRAVVHGIEGRNLIDAHGRHFEQAGDLVHDADGSETGLALAEVEERHDGRLLVLRRVAFEDLGDDGLILLVELERQVGVVVFGVSVLERERM
jgi:hypothetical protein